MTYCISELNVIRNIMFCSTRIIQRNCRK